MNAERILVRVADALAKCRLEAVLIGNAAAALQGAPVTTLDFDFMFRRTPANLAKLRRMADLLGGQILRPYYPASGLFRLVVEFEGRQLLVAALGDILRSKRAANRPRDRAVLDILQKTIDEKEAKDRRA